MKLSAIHWVIIVIVLPATVLGQVAPATLPAADTVQPTDYMAVINAEEAKGVKPADNAAIPMLEALGFDPSIDAAEQAQAWRMLGVKPQATREPEIIGLSDFLKVRHRNAITKPGASDSDSDALMNEEDAFQSRPWKDAEYPDVAAWLDNNRVSLELLSKAAEQPNYFMPLVHNKGKGEGFIPLIGWRIRGIRQALLAMALRKIGNGQTEDGVKFLIVLHKLAVMVQKHGTSIQWLITTGFQGRAFRCERMMIQDGQLPHAELLLHGLEESGEPTGARRQIGVMTRSMELQKLIPKRVPLAQKLRPCYGRMMGGLSRFAGAASERTLRLRWRQWMRWITILDRTADLP